MNEYRITKYDPKYRVNGVYERYEWSAVSDVGQPFADGVLTQETVERTLDGYVSCVVELMRSAGVQALCVSDLDPFDQPCRRQDGQALSLSDAGEVVRACLAETCWCRLAGADAFVHFGYDLYMYVGVALPFEAVRDIAAQHDLFAEPFASPYQENRKAPETTGPFTFSAEAQAPAAGMLTACLTAIERASRVTSLAPYTDALDRIGIIPCCLSAAFMQDFPTKERRYISWQKRYADVRLHMDFPAVVNATPAERMALCRAMVEQSLRIVKARCNRKQVRFDLDALLADLFPTDDEGAETHGYPGL